MQKVVSFVSPILLLLQFGDTRAVAFGGPTCPIRKFFWCVRLGRQRYFRKGDEFRNAVSGWDSPTFSISSFRALPHRKDNAANSTEVGLSLNDIGAIEEIGVLILNSTPYGDRVRNLIFCPSAGSPRVFVYKTAHECSVACRERSSYPCSADESVDVHPQVPVRQRIKRRACDIAENIC